MSAGCSTTWRWSRSRIPRRRGHARSRPTCSGIRACAPTPTCCTARRFAGRSAPPSLLSSPCTTSQCCATRSGSTAGRAPTPASPCRGSLLLRIASSPSRSSPSASSARFSEPMPRRSESSRTRSRMSSHPRDRAPRATTCSPSGRSSRGRISRGSRRQWTVSSASSAREAGAASSLRATSPGSADISDEELAAQYRGARCLVYASLYEGFGIPVGEALACGCPVVTSRDSAMAELAGAAATYVDPEDVASIRTGIEQASRPEPRRGPTWADVAARTLAVYEELA